MAASVTNTASAHGRAPVAALLALGASLARRGPMAVVSMAISLLTVGAMCTVALASAAREGGAPAHALPSVAASALAYGGAFLHAVSAAMGALRRDRAEGVVHLFVSRAASLRSYTAARIGGLAALLAAEVGGGALVVGVVAMLASSRPEEALRVAQMSAASVAFGVAFAIVMAPVALAALGARARGAGYLFLLAILFLPELLAASARGSFPSEIVELFAIPSALDALRGSLAPGSVDLLRFVRALVALGVFTALGVAFVHRDAALLGRQRGAA